MPEKAATSEPWLCNGLPHRKRSDGRYLSYGHTYRRVEDKAERDRAEFNRGLERLRPLERRLSLVAAAAGATSVPTSGLRLRAQLAYRAVAPIEDEDWHSDGFDGEARPGSLREVAALIEQRDILNEGGRRRRVLEDSSSGENGREDFGQNVERDLLQTDGFHIAERESHRQAGSVFTAAEMWDAYEKLPFGSDEIRAASSRRGIRSTDQELLLDRFRFFLAVYQASPTDIHRVTDVPLRTIERYKREGAMLIEMMREAFAADVREIVDEANERQLRAILAVFDIDPVRDAEDILAEGEAA